jgi:hypothetical protein
MAADGLLVAAGAADGTLAIVTTDKWHVVARENLPAAITTLKWHPSNARVLAVGSADGRVTLVELDRVLTSQKPAPDFNAAQFLEEAKKEVANENWEVVVRAINLLAAYPASGIDPKELDNLRFPVRKAMIEQIDDIDRNTTDPDELEDAAKTLQLAIDIDPAAPLAATARGILAKLPPRTPSLIEKANQARSKARPRSGPATPAPPGRKPVKRR